MKIEYIDIDYIIPNKDQPRKYFNEETLQDLIESVNRNGILQPILLKNNKNGYEIIAGERRWRAAMELNMDKIPAIILKDLDEAKQIEISIIENLQRENLSPIEEALAFKKYLKTTKKKQEELANILGKSRAYISNTMRLLSLPKKIINDLENFKINSGHAKAILSLKDEKLQIKLCNIIKKKKLSVRESESIAQKWNKSSNETEISREQKLDRLIKKDLEKRLTNSMGLKVNFKDTKNKKIIQIECINEEQLERMIDLLENYSNNKQSKEQ